MSDLTTTFTNIANAIRSKTGSSDTMTPSEMPDEIAEIETPMDSINITQNGTYEPSAGRGYNQVVVEVPEPTLITKSITANGTYNASADNADGYSQVTVAVDGFKKKSIANTPTDIASFNDGTANPMPSLEISINPVQSGSGDPSPSNVRPISGWSGANVTRCGKNLYKAELNNYYLDVVTGLPVVQTGYEVSEFIPILANQSIYIPDSGSARRWFYDKFKNPKTYLNSSENQTYTAQKDGYIRVTVNKNIAGYSTYQIEYGNAPTTYEPYNGSTLSIPFHDNSDNPITVYRGTLNVTSGELRVTHEITDLGTKSYTRSTYGSNTVFYCYIGNCADILSSQAADALCSCYKMVSNDVIYSGFDKGISITKKPSDPYAIVRMANSDYTDVTAFTQSLSNQKLVYPLATPITYQLTPAQVSTLLGQNNIFADCGQVLQGEYFVTL